MKNLLVVVLVFIPFPRLLRAEVIDRIVAVVEKHIITLSDIRAERTMREVLGEPIPKSDRELLAKGLGFRHTPPFSHFCDRIAPTTSCSTRTDPL